MTLLQAREDTLSSAGPDTHMCTRNSRQGMFILSWCFHILSGCCSKHQKPFMQNSVPLLLLVNRMMLLLFNREQYCQSNGSLWIHIIVSEKKIRNISDSLDYNHCKRHKQCLKEMCFCQQLSHINLILLAFTKSPGIEFITVFEFLFTCYYAYANQLEWSYFFMQKVKILCLT